MIATSQALENARRGNVERRWPRFRWDAKGRSRWVGWDWRNYLHVVICGLLISATVLEAALSKNGEKEPWWPFGLLAESPAGLAVLALLILGNGWLVDRSLADRTPNARLVPVWLCWLRRAVVSVPVVGLYAIPVWHWIIRTRPAWAFRTFTPPSLDLIVPSEAVASLISRLLAWGRSLRRSRGQSFLALLLWMIAGQVAPWLALLSWLTTAETLSPGHRSAIFGLSALCHVLACAFGLQYAVIRGGQIRAVRWKVVALRLAPLSFLLPFPFFTAGLLLWMVLAGEETETFVGRSHSNKSRPAAYIPLARGSSIGRLIRSLTRGKRELDVILNDLLPGTLQNSEVQEHQLAFYRLKTFLLLFDAAALAYLAAGLGRPMFSMSSLTIEFSPFLVLATLGAIVEITFMSVRVIGWLRREGLSYQPYGRALIFTQLALGAGLLFGSLAGVGDAVGTGLLLMGIGLVTAVASTLLFAPASFLLRLPGRQTVAILAWTALFFELFIVSTVMRLYPELAPPFMNLFKIAMALTPVWSLALFLGLRGWLLHPFQLGHLFEPRLPRRARATLAAVALTAAPPGRLGDSLLDLRPSPAVAEI